MFSRTFFARAAVACVLGVVALQPAASHAEASDAEPFARVVDPLPPNNARGTLVRVQIEGPAEDWGVRRFAETMDDRWPGLRVRSHGTCADRPGWVCVRVVVGDWDDAAQLAVFGAPFMGAVSTPEVTQRDMYLNSHYVPASAYAVAAHEFGHVLGLNHHLQDGICGAVPDVTTLSWAEDRALRPYYGRAMTG